MQIGDSKRDFMIPVTNFTFWKIQGFKFCLRDHVISIYSSVKFSIKYARWQNQRKEHMNILIDNEIHISMNLYQNNTFENKNCLKLRYARTSIYTIQYIFSYFCQIWKKFPL